MSEHERIVTADDLRKLVKAEGIRPETLFDESALKDIRDKARAEGYAEARLKAHVADGKPTPDADGLPDHLNPKKNPWLKTE